MLMNGMCSPAQTRPMAAASMSSHSEPWRATRPAMVSGERFQRSAESTVPNLPLAGCRIVKASLPAYGAYVSEVLLAYGKRVDRTRLVITRAASAPSFAIDDVPPSTLDVPLRAADKAVRAPPTWKYPVGDGAKRTRGALIWSRVAS